MRDYTTSIVIPIHKHFDLCNTLLNGLFKHEQENIDSVLIVDNGSMEDVETNEGIAFWENSSFPVYTARIKEAIGFTPASNLGLKSCEKPVASKHITFLISSDVKINGRFVQQTADTLFGARKSLVGNKLLFGDTGWNTFGARTFEYLEGWFLACTSDGWRELGYFDERYAESDYEDVDLSTTAKKIGYKLVALNNPSITHLGGGTYGYTSERLKRTLINKEKFRQKWVD